MEKFTLLFWLLIRTYVAGAQEINAHPSWSPNGKWIAFDRKVEGKTDIYIIRPSGQDLTQLTFDGVFKGGPSWKGNQELIYVMREEEDYIFYQVDIIEKIPVKVNFLTFGSVNLFYTEDQAKVAFSYPNDEGGTDIWIYNTTTQTGEKMITNNFWNGMLFWHPSGGKIGFSSDMNKNRQLYELDLDTRQIVQLTSSDHMNIGFNYHPDGNRILYHSDRESEGIFHTYILNKEKETETKLTSGEGFSGVPSWSPTGDSIIFEQKRDLYIMDNSGKILRRLLDPKD